MSVVVRALGALLIAPAVALFVASPALVAQTPKVGPAHGTVIVVGGGSMGPDLYAKFIEAAGGPDALIIDVPTAGGDTVYAQDAPGTRGWKNAGAKNIYVYHTNDRKLADSDSFVAILKKAGGIWFEGGRQFHLVDSYAGTKSETEFRNVLARGGVIAGSSAGASIIGDFLVRGAPSNNNFIMDSPGYEKGFAYLKGVGIDQHVVARERLADLADSIMPKYPDLLAISEDEGTAWVVNGDTARIVGRNKAFVYGGKDATDGGKPFLTLHPGDVYNLATRRVTHRAADDSPVTAQLISSLFKKYSDPSAGGATVLVAQDGKVFIDQSFGIADQPKYMPTTTVPQFNVGGITDVFNALCAQIPDAPARGGAAAAPANDSAPAARGAGRGRGTAPPSTPFQNCITRRVSTPIGMHKTSATPDGQVLSDVDELYRLELGLQSPRTFNRDTAIDYTKGWQVDTYRNANRLSAYGAAGGKRSAFVRFPDKHAAIIILTNDDTADAKGMAEKIAAQLLTGKKP
ncbi:MAG: peptidase dipeptidase [Gemmatimonadetes bacterium]|nr:peptidase dipeptidase [Gemmatimonadota bacterium]